MMKTSMERKRMRSAKEPQTMAAVMTAKPIWNIMMFGASACFELTLIRVVTV